MKTLTLILPLAMLAFGLCAAEPTPAELKIRHAREGVEQMPDRPQAYNRLAMAHTFRARETHDPAHYDKAEEVLAKSLEIDPGNYGARRVRVWVLLGRHDFKAALNEAEELNKVMPDDLMLYGMMADAAIELGRLSEAEGHIQRMLDLRPGNVPALTRAAYFRELTGDPTGALDLYQQAYARTPPREYEQQAWLLTQMAHLRRLRGDYGSAASLLEKSLEAFTDYHYALEALAGIRHLQGDEEAAKALYERLYEVAPHPENLYKLAGSLRRLGNHGIAMTSFQTFEEGARSEMNGTDNANLELIEYYLEVAGRPEVALEVARVEMGRRQGLYVREAYARALLANGKKDEALKQIKIVLEAGLEDGDVFLNAAKIARANGRADMAADYVRAAEHVNPRITATPNCGMSGSSRIARDRLRSRKWGQVNHSFICLMQDRIKADVQF